MSLLPVSMEPAVPSVFAGADIAATARLNWLGGCPRPRFEDDVWSFVGWADAPVQMKMTEKKVLFDRITHQPWRGRLLHRVAVVGIDGPSLLHNHQNQAETLRSGVNARVS